MKLLNGWTIIEGRLVRPNSIMCRDDEPITAKEVKQCLGIPIPTTEFFNHAGVVPASAIVREAIENGVRKRGRPVQTVKRSVWMRVTPDEAALIKDRRRYEDPKTLQPGNFEPGPIQE